MDITLCNRCPRLRKYCAKVAATKRKAFQNETYWGKPVPSFGDKKPELFVLGLAPAAHGANRTGRMFTGDRSGLWLYRALHKAGFANQAVSTSRGDGLILKGTYISALAHCAPPGNKPTPKEISNCRSYLNQEIQKLKTVRVYLALGGMATKGFWEVLKAMKCVTGACPKFSHGGEFSLPNGKWLLMSYHPSQQNTFTGRLTEPMFNKVFTRATELITARLQGPA